MTDTETPTTTTTGHTPRVYQCKYDPSHGRFRTGKMLGEHYMSAHADVHEVPNTSKRVRCRRCDKVLSLGAAYAHLRKVHRIAAGVDWRSTMIDPVDADLVLAPVQARTPRLPVHSPSVVQCPEPGCGAHMRPDNLARHREKMHTRKVAASPPAPHHHPSPESLDVTADDSVLGFVDAMAGPDGSVKVQALRPLFTWRTQTAEMLRAVADEGGH
jgi:hypothetical protein